MRQLLLRRARRLASRRAPSAPGTGPAEAIAAVVEIRQCNVELGDLARRSHWPGAVQLLGDLRLHAIEPDIVSYNSAIHASALGARWEHCACLLDEMREYELIPDAATSGALIKGYGRGWQWAQALALLQDSMAPADTVSYVAAISACAAGARWMHGLAVLAMAARRCLTLSLIHLSAAATTCTRGAQWRRALALINEAQWLRLQLDVVAYGAAINACTAGAQWRWGLAFLEEMRCSNVTPSSVVWNAAVSMCSADSRWTHALALLAVSLRVSLRGKATGCNAAMTACTRGKNWQRCLWLLAWMRLERVWLDVVSYGAAISGCRVGKQWELAVAFLRVAWTRGLDVGPVGCSAALSACSAGAKWELCLSLLEESRPRCGGGMLAPDLQCYNAVITGLASAAAWSASLGLLDIARMERLYPDAISCCTALDACEAVGESGVHWRRLEGIMRACAVRLLLRPPAVGWAPAAHGAVLVDCRIADNGYSRGVQAALGRRVCGPAIQLLIVPHDCSSLVSAASFGPGVEEALFSLGPRLAAQVLEQVLGRWPSSLWIGRGATLQFRL